MQIEFGFLSSVCQFLFNDILLSNWLAIFPMWLFGLRAPLLWLIVELAWTKHLMRRWIIVREIWGKLWALQVVELSSVSWILSIAVIWRTDLFWIVGKWTIVEVIGWSLRVLIIIRTSTSATVAVILLRRTKLAWVECGSIFVQPISWVLVVSEDLSHAFRKTCFSIIDSADIFLLLWSSVVVVNIGLSDLFLIFMRIPAFVSVELVEFLAFLVLTLLIRVVCIAWSSWHEGMLAYIVARVGALMVLLLAMLPVVFLSWVINHSLSQWPNVLNFKL